MFDGIIKKYSAKIIKENGEEYAYEFKDTPTFKEIYPQIHTDIIQLISLDKNLEMWIDEEGKLKDNKKINHKATLLWYNALERVIDDVIIGDVAIVERIEDDEV